MSAIKAAAGLKFKKGKFVGLDVPAAIEILVGADSDLYGHKNVLFAGLKAWLLDPKGLAPSRHAIASAVAERIAKSERSKAKVPVDIASTTRAIFNRFKPKYRDFYEQIYHQIGGMAAIRSAIRYEAKANATRAQARKRIPIMLGLASILDFHVRDLLIEKKLYGPPSIKKAGAAVHLISSSNLKKQMSSSNVWAYWAQYDKALPFLFGASHLEISPGITLLDRILENKLTLQQAESHFSAWFSYAKYFRDCVLSNSQLRPVRDGKGPKNPKGGKLRRFVQIRGVEATKPEVPPFDEALGNNLRQHISKKNPSEKVVRHH